MKFPMDFERFMSYMSGATQECNSESPFIKFILFIWLFSVPYSFPLTNKQILRHGTHFFITVATNPHKPGVFLVSNVWKLVWRLSLNRREELEENISLINSEWNSWRNGFEIYSIYFEIGLHWRKIWRNFFLWKKYCFKYDNYYEYLLSIFICSFETNCLFMLNNFSFNFVALIMVVSAQLNILNDTLKNLKKDAENEYKQYFRTENFSKSLMVDEIMYRKLAECVQHHHLILE